MGRVIQWGYGVQTTQITWNSWVTSMKTVLTQDHKATPSVCHSHHMSLSQLSLLSKVITSSPPHHHHVQADKGNCFKRIVPYTLRQGYQMPSFHIHQRSFYQIWRFRLFRVKRKEQALEPCWKGPVHCVQPLAEQGNSRATPGVMLPRWKARGFNRNYLDHPSGNGTTKVVLRNVPDQTIWGRRQCTHRPSGEE